MHIIEGCSISLLAVSQGPALSPRCLSLIFPHGPFQLTASESVLSLHAWISLTSARESSQQLNVHVIRLFSPHLYILRFVILNTSAKSPLPYSIIYSEASEIRAWISLGTNFSYHNYICKLSLGLKLFQNFKTVIISWYWYLGGFIFSKSPTLSIYYFYNHKVRFLCCLQNRYILETCWAKSDCLRKFCWLHPNKTDSRSAHRNDATYKRPKSPFFLRKTLLRIQTEF